MDELIPQHTDALHYQNMMGDLGNCFLSKDIVHQLLRVYVDKTKSSESTLKEVPLIFPKGRQRKDTNVQLRDKTRLEHLQEDAKATKPCKGTKMTRAKEKLRKSEQNKQHTFVLNLDFGHQNVDEFMVTYIARTRAIVPDGHCGYRSLAELLWNSQEEWRKIRIELTHELRTNRVLYTSLYRGFTYVLDELITRVNYLGDTCTSEFWMELPMRGLVFATRFQCALVCLLKNFPHTCLPLIAPLPPVTCVIGIALIGDGDHFVPVWLSPDSPMPPPIRMWINHHDSSVDGWDAAFSDRIALWTRYRERDGLVPNPA